MIVIDIKFSWVLFGVALGSIVGFCVEDSVGVMIGLNVRVGEGDNGEVEDLIGPKLGEGLKD